MSRRPPRKPGVTYWTPALALDPTVQRADHRWVCERCLAVDFYTGIFLGHMWTDVNGRLEEDQDFVVVDLQAATCRACGHEHGLDEGRPLRVQFSVWRIARDPALAATPAGRFALATHDAHVAAAREGALVCALEPPDGALSQSQVLDRWMRDQEDLAWRQARDATVTATGRAAG